jgi:cell division protein FtsB
VLERRASLLRPDHLDPDMLEERARTILNFARPDEIVVIAPRRPKS